MSMKTCLLVQYVVHAMMRIRVIMLKDEDENATVTTVAAVKKIKMA
jgi:hypothetical protein